MEVLYAYRSAAHWVHRASLPEPSFKVSGSRYVRSAVHSTRLKVELILPRATPLRSSFAQPPRRSPFGARLHLPLGFVPSSRLHSRAATFFRRASHAPLRSVLRLSQPRDGFFRSVARRLIPSRCHVQGPLSFRGFSPAAATLPHRKELSSMPLLLRRSYPRSDFRRLACKSTYAASRLRGFHLRQAAFLESGYSPRPKPLPSSNFSLLQVRSLDAGLRSHGDRPLMMLRVRCLSAPSSCDVSVAIQLRGHGLLRSPGQP